MCPAVVCEDGSEPPKANDDDCCGDLSLCPAEIDHLAIVQQMQDGNFNLGQVNMQFLISADAVSRVEIQEDMYPDLMNRDGMAYHRDDQEFYDFILVDVLGVITMPSEERSSAFVYVDVTYIMTDGKRIGFEGHFGDAGENNLENNVMWVYGIFEYTGDNEELQPDYYTGYQITSYFLCLGRYEYCRTEMLAYQGDNWNSPSPMDAVELTEKLDAAVMKYLNAGGFPPFDWKSDLVFNVIVQDKEPYNSQMDFAGTYTVDQALDLFMWLQSNICQTEECNAAYAARPQSFVYAYDGQWLDSGYPIQHFHMGMKDDENEPIWGYAIFAYTGEPACPSQDANGVENYPDGCGDFAGWQIIHDYFCMGEFEYCQDTAMIMWTDIWVPLPEVDTELPECTCSSYESGSTSGTEMCQFGDNCALASNFDSCPPNALHCVLPSVPTTTEASSGECTAEPMSPYTNDKGLVPQGELLIVPEANLPTGVDCGGYVFEPMTYEQVPDECCRAEGAVSVLKMADAFAESTCTSLPPIDTGNGQMINVNLAGGCSDEGDFFYAEQCGGSNFGPFSYLSDGTFLGLGSCVQSATECECNGYVNTKSSGCFNVAAFEGSGERYFMRVDDPVCAVPESVESLPCAECDGMNPEPLTAEEIVHTQDEGAVSLNFGTDPSLQLGPKFQFAENIVVTTVVQDAEPYRAKSSQAGTFGQFDSGVPLNFVDVLTMPAADAPLDTGAISAIQFVYTTWVDWISDTQIGQAFYLGTRGEDLTNDVLWGWCIFEFTDSAIQKEILPAYATGYQITHDYFCYGTLEYCESQADDYFESLGWEIIARTAPLFLIYYP